MIKEEILKMEAGREMDALVDEVIFKWKIKWMECQRDPECGELEAHVWTRRSTGSDGWPIEKHPCYHVGGMLWKPIPFRSSDISATWEIEEKMNGLALQDEYSTTLYMVLRHDNPTELHIPDFCMVHATPHQRCRAALLAAMGEK